LMRSCALARGLWRRRALWTASMVMNCCFFGPTAAAATARVGGDGALCPLLPLCVECVLSTGWYVVIVIIAMASLAVTSGRCGTLVLHQVLMTHRSGMHLCARRLLLLLQCSPSLLVNGWRCSLTLRQCLTTYALQAPHEGKRALLPNTQSRAFICRVCALS
jgi:hypothetical protein